MASDVARSWFAGEIASMMQLGCQQRNGQFLLLFGEHIDSLDDISNIDIW